jgi:hypothetical protein
MATSNAGQDARRERDRAYEDQVQRTRSRSWTLWRS